VKRDTKTNLGVVCVLPGRTDPRPEEMQVHACPVQPQPVLRLHPLTQRLNRLLVRLQTSTETGDGRRGEDLVDTVGVGVFCDGGRGGFRGAGGVGEMEG
jgi:hypothetical protein